MQMKVIMASIVSLAILFRSFSVMAQLPEYNESQCQQVANTLDIFWEAVSCGAHTACTGIEHTDGILEDARDGTVRMRGISVSNPSCLGTGEYIFAVSGDGLALTGADIKNGVTMKLTRTADQNCFVGHWVKNGCDYRAHIAASPFLSARDPYDPILCEQVANTVNIFWEALSCDFPCQSSCKSGCTAIEYTTWNTEGDGAQRLSGMSVSDATCIGTAVYRLTVSPDLLTLTGEDTQSGVPMVLTRSAGQACFVGHWVSPGGCHYRAHISVRPVSIQATSWGTVKGIYR